MQRVAPRIQEFEPPTKVTVSYRDSTMRSFVTGLSVTVTPGQPSLFCDFIYSLY
jgi:hypothetical protein